MVQMWAIPAGLTVAEALQQDDFHAEVCTTAGAAPTRTCSRFPQTSPDMDIDSDATQGCPPPGSCTAFILHFNLQREATSTTAGRTSAEDRLLFLLRIRFEGRCFSVGDSYTFKNHLLTWINTDKPFPYLSLKYVSHNSQHSEANGSNKLPEWNATQQHSTTNPMSSSN